MFVDNRTGKTRACTPKETTQYERSVAMFAQVALHGINPSFGSEGKWPKNARYSLQLSVAYGDNRRRDIDNVLKSCADALNGVCWDDDAQVHHMAVTRVFEGEPRTEVKVEVLP